MARVPFARTAQSAAHRGQECGQGAICKGLTFELVCRVRAYAPLVTRCPLFVLAVAPPVRFGLNRKADRVCPAAPGPKLQRGPLVEACRGASVHALPHGSLVVARAVVDPYAEPWGSGLYAEPGTDPGELSH